MTYTPKPWHVDSTHVRHAVNSGDVHIAMVNIGPGLTEDEAIANAYLIAATPEMFEALEAVDGWFEGDRKNEPKTWLELGAIVKQAIAIAKTKGDR